MADLDEKGLLPCPFCGDRMRYKYETVSHIEQGECPIGAYGWGGLQARRAWNRRALPSPVTPASDVVEAAYLLLSEIDAGNDAEHINGATGPLRSALASLAPAQGEREGGAK